MRTLAEIKGEIEALIKTFDELIKAPIQFRSTRMIERKIQDLLKELNQDLEEIINGNPALPSKS